MSRSRSISRRQFQLAAAAPLLLGGLPSSARANAQWEPWRDLVNFLPTKEALNKARTSRNRAALEFEVQRIEDAKKPKTNLDRYEVVISRLPTAGPAAGSPAKLYLHLRQQLSDFFDHGVSNLVPYDDGDGKEWNSANVPPIGCAMVFNIRSFAGAPDERGAVVVSASSATSFQFTPIRMSLLPSRVALPIGTHPVAGNREFGLKAAPGGTHVFYTRAADRAYDTLPPEDTVLSGAQKLWKSMQVKVAEFVNASGGAAKISPPVVLEPTFEELRHAKIFTRA